MGAFLVPLSIFCKYFLRHVRCKENVEENKEDLAFTELTFLSTALNFSGVGGTLGEGKRLLSYYKGFLRPASKCWV